MFSEKKIFIVGFLVSIALASCNGYQKLMKSDDFGLKYEKAMEYYEIEDYYRALNLFDQVVPFYRGTEKAEEIAYRYAYAYYYQGDYILASYYFDRYIQTFQTSDKTEECAYMKAFCKYLDSPDYNLDQTNTFTAIAELQLFINAFPESPRVEQANTLLEELHSKLQMKQFELAKMYLEMDLFKAAITSFENLLNDYPDTPYREEATFRTIEAYFDYAEKSISDKQEGRYTAAVDTYKEFTFRFPESRFLKEAEQYFQDAQEALINL